MLVGLAKHREYEELSSIEKVCLLVRLYLEINSVCGKISNQVFLNKGVNMPKVYLQNLEISPCPVLTSSIAEEMRQLLGEVKCG